MYIKTIVIKNLRALQDISFDLSPRVNVIVGPNAIGKTTILQAIRLLKAVLAPRTSSETQQTLISLGAASPHFPQKLFTAALARDANKDIEISCNIAISAREIALLESEKPSVVRRMLQAQMGQPFGDPSLLLQFEASPQGHQASVQARALVEAAITRLKAEKTLTLGISFSSTSGQISSQHAVEGLLIAHLDTRLSPHKTVFSYFPADRALPPGEVGIQLGAADSQQLLESHNSQPQIKFNRLKNLIFNNVVMGKDDRASLEAEFDKIFKEILRGRRIKDIGINQLGLLSVMIEDLETNRTYEIDSLSSGEKGLTLTFLIIAKSMERGGLVLLDEPELHLNPAVSKDVLRFLMQHYSKPLDIQFVLCTHSPEILSGAFEDEECSLLHVISETTVAKVSHRALDEYSDALQKLGTNVSEGLLYKGTVFVEGDDDVDFLEQGFDHLLKRHRIKDRGGRKEVEKAAKKLQELERRGNKVDPIFIIFDRDEEVTDLESSEAVKIMQWTRRCMENYLIDTEVIAGLLKMKEIVSNPIQNEGDVSTLLRRLALGQLDEVAARKVYNDRNYNSPGLRSSDVERKSLVEMADALYTRVASARISLQVEEESAWRQTFLRQCEEVKRQLTATWELKWKEECDGKQLFTDLQKEGILKISVSSLKRKIIQEMKTAKSENWRIVESQLQQLIA